MIKITEQINYNKKLPELPFITKDRVGIIRMYIRLQNQIRYFDVKTGAINLMDI